MGLAKLNLLVKMDHSIYFTRMLSDPGDERPFAVFAVLVTAMMECSLNRVARQRQSGFLTQSSR